MLSIAQAADEPQTFLYISNRKVGFYRRCVTYEAAYFR